MSFILDALRKSEHERRRGALPGVAHIPYALPRARLPVWVPLAIAALALALLLTGFAWWYTTRPAAGGGAPRLAAAPQAAGASAGASTWPAAPPIASPPASQPLPIPPQQRAVAPTPPPSTTRGADAPSSAPPRAESPWPVEPPAASALAAAGLIPPLTLQLLVYDSDPARRFVRINGIRYAEGAFLSEGPQLVRIDARSVVLRHQGRDFVLAPE